MSPAFIIIHNHNKGHVIVHSETRTIWPLTDITYMDAKIKVKGSTDFTLVLYLYK